MQNVYVEPLPKGQWGPVEGYTLEFVDGTKVTTEVFQSERLAISEIKLRGYIPLLAKVRITDKQADMHWQRAEA